MSEPSPAPPGDSATASILVTATCEDAFGAFTREIDLWWKQGPAYRIAGKRRGTLCFERGELMTSLREHVAERGVPPAS